MEIEKEDRETLLFHINNGICFNCISQKNQCKKKDCCQINNIKNGDRYATYITNSLNINSNIKNCGKKFDKKKQFSICKRINEDCKNCIDGRFDTFEHEGKEFFYCFSEYPGKMYIYIYLHCDLELVGSRCSPKIIPLENIYKNMNEQRNIDKRSFKQYNENNDNNQNSCVSNDKCFHNLNVVEENNFPMLNNVKVNIKSPLIEYSKILKDFPKDECDDLKDNLIIENPAILNEKNEKDDIINLSSNKDININLSNENLIKNECNFLKNENIFLNEKIQKLQIEIKTIKDQLIVDLKKINNKNIYEEMEFNEKEINTSVAKTFMDTHYSEYKIF